MSSNSQPLSKTNAVGKPKKTKSRTGCVTCKKRRLKCDETKPLCQNCVKRGIVCGGYVVNFKWRDFNNTAEISTKNSNSNLTIENPVKGGSSLKNEQDKQKDFQLKQAMKDATKSVTGRSAEEIAIANVLIANGKNPDVAAMIASTIANLSDTESTKQFLINNTQSNAVNNSAPAKIQSEKVEDAVEKTQSSGKIVPESPDTKLLESLADIASKEPASPTVPLSPLNENFASSNYDENSKRNTFNSALSPQVQNLSKSPNIAAFLNAYQNEYHDTRSLSGHQLPKFEEIDTIQLSSSKPSPGVIDTPNLSYLNSIASPRLLPLLNEPSLQLQPVHLKSSTAVTPIMDLNTPKNPNSPYSTLLNYINSTSSNIENLKTQNNNQVAKRNYFSGDTDPGSPQSVTSDLSSKLDFTDHPHPFNQVVTMPPINLYSLHLPDDQLSTLQAFDQHTAAIMSIKNGPSENPWRTFLLPMSANHEVVRSALLAMTCFHIARGDTDIRAKGVKYMKKAIMSLVNGLSSNKSHRITDFSANSDAIARKTPPDVALATCIALAMGEAWERHISTGIAHLRGAKSMVIKVLNKMQGKKKKRRSNKMKRSSSLSMKRSYNFMSEDGRPDSASKNHMNFNPILEDDENNNGFFTGNNAIDESEVIEDEEEEEEDLASLKDKVLPRELQFLVNAWMYFDILARMTSESESDVELPELEYELDSNDSNSTKDKSPENFEISTVHSGSSSSTVPNSMRRSHSHSTISSSSIKNIRKKKSKEPDSASVIAKFRSFNLDEGDTIDPLLGVAQSLFPLMGEVADLIGKVRKYKCMIQKNNSTLKTIKTPLRSISKCVELKSKIEKWEIPNLPNLSNSIYNSNNMKLSTDPTFDINATVATAEAYRYSTLLYLHQVIHEVPSPSSHSLAENVMMLLASVPSNSRTLVTHIFPLFVASCEAQQGEEREWVKERWNELVDKMWIGTIDRAWEVVKEVWRRKDIVANNKMNKYDNSSNNSGTNLNDYSNVKRRISVAIHGSDNLLDDDEDNNFLSWSHWTTVMKEWGWEILLA